MSDLLAAHLFARITSIQDRLANGDDDAPRDVAVLLRTLELELAAVMFPTHSDRDQARETYIGGLCEDLAREADRLTADDDATPKTISARDVLHQIVYDGFATKSDPQWFAIHCISLFNDLDRLLPRLPQTVDSSTTDQQELAVRAVPRHH
jgi:hypothetical protein